jgi:hypothetical protein
MAADIAAFLNFKDGDDNLAGEKLGLGDTRHDFGLTSQDTAIQVAVPGGQKVLDLLRGFAGNLQRLALFGGRTDLSKHLTSTCKGRGVMGGSPEDSIVKYIEHLAGIPHHTPSDFAPANIADKNAEMAAAARSAGWLERGVTYGNGFRKILINATPTMSNIAWPTDAKLRDYKEARRAAAGGAAVDRDTDTIYNEYQNYHRRIAEALGWTAGRGLIPVVVDTTKTLHRAGEYFIVCANAENKADPGPSSTMLFEYKAEEIGGAGAGAVAAAIRRYSINNVVHTVSGGIINTRVTYTIPGNNILDGAASKDIVYDYSGNGISPNSIETCKGKIKGLIDTFVKATPNPTTYQTITEGDSTVARLIKLFSPQCNIYDTFNYNTAFLTPAIIQDIISAFIAKRGGDQLQIGSCQQPPHQGIQVAGPAARPVAANNPISYRLNKVEYVPPPARGLGARGRAPLGELALRPIAGIDNTVINNCVFVTYDRVAAMFAIMLGITTILQTASKEAIIYKNDAYDTAATPPRAAAPAAGVPWGVQVAAAAAGGGNIVGGACTRDTVERIRRGELGVAADNPEAAGFNDNRRIGQACLNKIIEDLCIPNTAYYDAFTLLDVIYYNTCLHSKTIINQIEIIIRKDNIKGKTMKWAKTSNITDRQRIRGYIISKMRNLNNMGMSQGARQNFIITTSNEIHRKMVTYNKNVNQKNKIITIHKIKDLHIDIDNCIRVNPSIIDAINTRNNNTIFGVIAIILFNIIQYFSNRGAATTVDSAILNANNYKDNVLEGIDINANINALFEISNRILLENPSPFPAAVLGQANPAITLNTILTNLYNIYEYFNPPGIVFDLFKAAEYVENSISKIIAEYNLDSDIILELNGVSIRYTGGLNNNIRLFDTELSISGIGGLISTISDIDIVKTRLYRLKRGDGDGIIEGGGNTFYESWAELQEIESDKLDIKQAEQVFIQFIDILGLCEGRYFLNRDLSDNFYTYNNEPVRHGGHTQIEMMAFIDSLLTEYYASRDDPSKLKLFLMSFIHFPYILDSVGLGGILTDIYAYINIWFNYQNVNTGEPKNYKELCDVMKIVMDSASKVAIEVQSKMSPDNIECANYLHTIFPIGHFATTYSVLESIIMPSENNAILDDITEEIIDTVGITKKFKLNKKPLQNTVKLAKGVRPLTPLTRLLSIPGAAANPVPGSAAAGIRRKREENTSNNGYPTDATVNNNAPTVPSPAKRFGLVSGGKKRHTKKKGSRRHTIKINRRKIHTKKRAQKRKTRHAIRKNK